MPDKGGGGGSDQTVGYRYYLSAHMGLGRGPFDELVEIEVGDREAWPQPDSSSTSIPAASLTYATIGDMLAAALLGIPTGTVVEVTADPEPTNDGVYLRVSDGSFVKYSELILTEGITESGSTVINAPDLFGGDKQEGGIDGTLQVMMGEATQVPPSFMTSIIDAGVNFRGVVTLFFDGLVTSMNPYPKVWRFRVRRSKKGWQDDTCWYPEKATITLAGGLIKAMNPAHMIYEALTNKTWGRGLPPTRLDENSFIYAANTLCAELFGLCIAWARQEDVDVFVQHVIDHIGGALYVDPSTGLYTLRLIRFDYDPETLPTFDATSGLILIEDDQNAGTDLALNELIVTFKNPLNRGKQGFVRAQNLAGFQSTGSIVSTTTDYPALPTAKLAAMVAERDLRIAALPLKKFKLKFDRRAWRFTPAMVFRINDPARGINNIVLRCGEIDRSTITDGAITVTAIQDIFGLNTATFYGVQSDGGFTAPSTRPAACTMLAFESSYRDVFRRLSSADFASITDDDSFICTVAAPPLNTITSGYRMLTKASGDPAYVSRGGAAYAPFGKLSTKIGPYDTTMTLTATQGIPPSLASPGLIIANSSAPGAALEVCKIVSYHPTTKELTLARGCADTVPAPWPVGSQVWFFDQSMLADSTSYAIPETISVRDLTQTPTALEELNSSASANVTTLGRFAKPYPPGNVKVATTDAFTAVDAGISFPTFTLSWAHRDRVIEQDQLVDYTGASVGPEAGTTYTVKNINPVTGSVLRTVTGLTGTTWDYDSTMATADGDIPTLRVEIWSVRDSLDSMQKWSFLVPRHVRTLDAAKTLGAVTMTAGLTH
jgi:hypothetical protein